MQPRSKACPLTFLLYMYKISSSRLVLAGMLLLFGSCAYGQRSATAAPTAEAIQHPENADYTLGPGDQVLIRVVDMEELSDKTVRIDPNGFVDLPLAGRLNASGLTLEQFKERLADKLKRYITNPQITINLTDDQSRPVSILGAVNSPGVHQLQGPKRLIEVISLAGGVRTDAGAKVIITREAKWGRLPVSGARTDMTGGFSTADVSLDDLLASKRPAENILILPNDIISVPKAEIIYVVGNVKKAGGFPLSSHDTMSLLQAVSLAGGTDRDANSKHARIIRPTEGNPSAAKEIPVDIDRILSGKAPDVQLYANDVLFIPNSATKSGTRRTAEAILQAATGFAVYGR